jgi:hypothetical protein
MIRVSLEAGVIPSPIQMREKTNLANKKRVGLRLWRVHGSSLYAGMGRGERKIALFRGDNKKCVSAI